MKKGAIVRLVQVFLILTIIYFLFTYKTKIIKDFSRNLSNDHLKAQKDVNHSKFYKIESFGSKSSSKVSVISHYFELKKSKHSHNDYLVWLRNFFLSVTCPLIIFTDSQSSLKDLIALRKPPTTLYITDSIWTIMKENELIRKRNYTYNYQNIQQSIDREKHYHNPNLYALWNLKSFISDKVAQENPYGSSTFIYSDGNRLNVSF
jgi:predicted  nucleic acid-binding Zn ribbon protein